MRSFFHPTTSHERTCPSPRTLSDVWTLYDVELGNTRYKRPWYELMVKTIDIGFVAILLKIDSCLGRHIKIWNRKYMKSLYI